MTRFLVIVGFLVALGLPAEAARTVIADQFVSSDGTKTWTLPLAAGGLVSSGGQTFTGDITAPNFWGHLYGNADSATRLAGPVVGCTNPGQFAVGMDQYGNFACASPAAFFSTVVGVFATAPITSSGGATPTISMPAATNLQSGYLTAADHTLFANGALSMGAFGAAPNANGGTIAAGVLTLQPADPTNPGGVSTGAQTFAGAKTFSGNLTTNGTLTIGAITGMLKATAGAVSAATAGTDYQAPLTLGNLTDVGTDGITVTGGTGAIIGAGASLSQHVADTTHNGYLASADWNTFNGKQAAGNYITATTGDVVATGPGSVTATIQAGAVTNSKMANMAAYTVKGNDTNASAAPADLSATQLNDVVARADLTLANALATQQSSDASTGAITALNTANITSVRLTGAAPAVQGIANGAAGKLLLLVNASGVSVTVSNQNATPLAANRILTGTGADITMVADASLLLQYDGTTTRWRVIGGSGGGSTSPLTTKGDLYGHSTVDARIPVGSDYQVLGADSTQALGVGYKDPQTTLKRISQTAHGFSVCQVLYYNGSAWATAKADADSTSDAVGIVYAVPDANTFVLATQGYVSGCSGLTAGAAEYLSDSSAGALTATQPTTVGHVSKPLGIAISTTEIMVNVERGIDITGSGTNNAVAIMKLTANRAVDSTANMVWDTVVTDTANAVSNGTFTAPTAGFYRVSATMLSVTAGSYEVYIYKNNAYFSDFGGVNATIATSNSELIQLAAGDTIGIRTSSSITIDGTTRSNIAHFEIQKTN